MTSATFWTGKSVLITGGDWIDAHRSTPGSRREGAHRRRSFQRHARQYSRTSGSGKVDFLHADLREPGVTRAAMHGVDTVFHIRCRSRRARLRGSASGRPGVKLLSRQPDLPKPCALKPKKIVFASSGCVYQRFSSVRYQAGSLFDRRSHQWPQRCRQHVRLGQAHGRIYAQGLRQGTRHRCRFLPLFHGCTVRAAWKITRSSP